MAIDWINFCLGVAYHNIYYRCKVRYAKSMVTCICMFDSVMIGIRYSENSYMGRYGDICSFFIKNQVVNSMYNSDSQMIFTSIVAIFVESAAIVIQLNHTFTGCIATAIVVIIILITKLRTTAIVCLLSYV